MPTGLGDEQLWLSATNDNTGTSTAFNDQSGQGNNGTAVGTLVVADTSEGGSYAYDFDGQNDDIDCSNAVTFTSNLVSVSTWINGTLPTTSGVFRTLVSKGNVSGETPFDLSFKGTGSSTEFRFYTFGSAAVKGITSYVTTMSSSQWYHVCGTYDNQTFRLYVDGVEVATAAWTGGLYDNSEDIRIGSIAISGVRQRYFDGMQDDVRIYNRALTQAEITHLASQRGVEGPAPVGLGDEQLWLCPSLNDSANDISGNGNDGTYNGGMGTIADTSNGGAYAYDFDGTDDFIQLPAGVVSASDPLTISLWVEHETTGNASRAYVSDWDYVATKRSVMFGSNAGNHLAYFSNTGSSVTQQITGSATSTVWTHVLISQSNTGDIEFYKDGVLDDTGGPYLGRFNSGSPWLVGALGTAASPGWLFVGLMDDIRAYNRTLTQAEITHLASQRGVEGPPPVGLGGEQLWLCPSLNDSAADISGSGNDGTYNGGMGTITDTSNGGSLAYDFDGTDDRIALGDTLDSVWTSGSWTISQWIYPEDATYNWYLSKYESGTKSQFLTNARNAGNGLRAGAVIYGAANGSINRGFEGTTNLSLNQWYHMVIEYDNSQPSDNQVRVWLDGVEETINIWASAGTLENIQDTAAELRINGLIDGNSTFFKPSRNDDVRVFDRALTQSEITHLATSRGIEGSPSGPTAQYNAFLTHAFKQLFQTRLR